MSSYLGHANGPDRAKSVAAVVAVHAALAAIILSGLNVRMVSQAGDRLSTFDVRTPPPPPPPKPPPPKPRPQQAKQPKGAPAKKATPSPIIAPAPRIPVRSTIVAAKVAGTGSASTSGAGASGTGTGAGGSGAGPGGGGMDHSRFTPARLVRNLRRGDYRRVATSRLPVGSADMALQVDPGGRVSSCRILRSSSDPAVDAGLCPLIRANLLFRPALDAAGRPMFFSTNYHASWSR